MQNRSSWSPAELMSRVEQLAQDGYVRDEIALRLGFKTIATFNGRLVRASQQTGRPIPLFKPAAKGTGRKRVDVVQIKRRGKLEGFGVNIPQEPLERLGAKSGDRLSVSVTRRRIVLALMQAPGAEKPKGPQTRPPRLIRKSSREQERLRRDGEDVVVSAVESSSPASLEDSRGR